MQALKALKIDCMVDYEDESLVGDGVEASALASPLGSGLSSPLDLEHPINHVPTCERCGRQFTTLRGLSIHFRVVHESTPVALSCHFCQREFVRSVHLNRHLECCTAREVVEKERKHFREQVLNLQSQFDTLVSHVLNEQ